MSANERLEELTSWVREHEEYYEASSDVISWIQSAKEELNRWNDVTSDEKEEVQKKLQKIQVDDVIYIS